MKHLVNANSNSVSSGIVCLGGVRKTGSKHTLVTDSRKKRSWTKFLIRNDFGIEDERHEVAVIWPTFIRMV